MMAVPRSSYVGRFPRLHMPSLPLLELFGLLHRHIFSVIGSHERLRPLIYLGEGRPKSGRNSNEQSSEQGMFKHWNLPVPEFHCVGPNVGSR